MSLTLGNITLEGEVVQTGAGVAPKAYEAHATDTVTTTSTTLIPRPTTPITITPPQGSYIANGSAWGGNNTNGQGYRIQLRVAGALVPETLREARVQSNQRTGLQFSKIITVDGTQAVEIYVSATANTATIEETSLTLQRVTP
jgi:hypothetical protein